MKLSKKGIKLTPEKRLQIIFRVISKEINARKLMSIYGINYVTVYLWRKKILQNLKGKEKFPPEQKLRIVFLVLSGGVKITKLKEVCDIDCANFYSWKKNILESLEIH